jgi:pimeloyl-ACP methyl ester carboxylesterase
MTDVAEPTFVLVTGAGATSFLWNPLVCELVTRGHRALPVELPGHGFDTVFPDGYLSPQDSARFGEAFSPIAGVSLADYVEQTVGVVQKVAPHGPVILVGHSLGGSTVTGVANRIPELLHRIVYVAAYCCVAAPTVLSYAPMNPSPDSPLSQGRQRSFIGNPALTGAARTNPYTGDPTVLAVQHRLLAADLDQEKMPALLAYATQPDEPAGVLVADARADIETWGRVPKTYIRTSRDEVIPIAVQDRIISEADSATPHNPFAVQTLAASHFAPITRVPDLADILTGQPI